MATKKNGGHIPFMRDKRVKYVPVGCGNCLECRRQKANAWRTRLLEEMKAQKSAKFVTLTFSDESLEKLIKESETKCESNEIAALAMRRFLERWRKKYKKSIKHWFIPELGHDGTERLHLHGIIFTDKSDEEIDERWAYGITHIGDYCNEKTVNYIVKYITKIDEKHKGFKGNVLCSPGIGKAYLDTPQAKMKRFQGLKTNDNYTLNNGTKVGNPIYYRNYLYTEEEREQLWLQRLDQKTIYILGLKQDISTIDGERKADRIRITMQEYNKRLGYGDDSKDWDRKEYNLSIRKINRQKKERELEKKERKRRNLWARLVQGAARVNAFGRRE